jgi:hypothetical protein
MSLTIWMINGYLLIVRSIKVGDDGRGAATATVPMTTPTSGSYFVTVQGLSRQSEMIVACGNLAAPTQ